MTKEEIAQKYGFIQGVSIHSTTIQIEENLYAAMEEYAQQPVELRDGEKELHTIVKVNPRKHIHLSTSNKGVVVTVVKLVPVKDLVEINTWKVIGVKFNLAVVITELYLSRETIEIIHQFKQLTYVHNRL